MVYQVRVTPFQSRRDKIEEEKKRPLRRERFYHYQNCAHDLPIIRLPIGLPIYRMENYRTQVAQKAHIHRHELATEFFRAGQENQTPQQAQHVILVDFAKQGSGDKVVPIMEVLEQEGRQTEPLLISSAGIVVNGNRRLAAMRELLATGESRYTTFSHVDCMVLPAGASPDEIKEVEVRLQMQAPTLLPYDWINQALAIRDLIESGGRSRKQVAEWMRMSKEDINDILLALGEAELYMEEWRHAPEDYTQVSGKRQLFRDVGRALKNKSGEDLQASRAIASILAEHSGDVDDRVYNYNFAFGNKSTQVLNRVAESLAIDLTSPVPNVDGNEGLEDTALDIDLGSVSNQPPTSFKPLIAVLTGRERGEEVFQAVKDVCDSIRDEDSGRQQGQRALEAVRKANTKLGEVDLSQANPSTFDAIRSQLASIRERVLRLDQQLAQVYARANGSGPVS